MLFKIKKEFFEKNKLADLKYLIRIIKEKRVAIIIAFSVLILGYLILRVFVFADISEARNHQEKLKNINKEMKNLDDLIAKHPNIDQEVELLGRSKNVLMTSFPKEHEFLSLANQVIVEMEENDIKIKDFKYIYDLPVPSVEGLTRYGLELECVAEFLNLAVFFESLERKYFRTGIYDLSITKIDDWHVSINMRIDFILSQER